MTGRRGMPRLLPRLTTCWGSRHWPSPQRGGDGGWVPCSFVVCCGRRGGGKRQRREGREVRVRGAAYALMKQGIEGACVWLKEEDGEQADRGRVPCVWCWTVSARSRREVEPVRCRDQQQGKRRARKRFVPPLTSNPPPQHSVTVPNGGHGGDRHGQALGGGRRRGGGTKR